MPSQEAVLPPPHAELDWVPSLDKKVILFLEKADEWRSKRMGLGVGLQLCCRHFTILALPMELHITVCTVRTVSDAIFIE